MSTILLLLLLLFIIIFVFLYNFNLKNYLSKNDKLELDLTNKNKSDINISFIPIGTDKHTLDGELMFGGLEIDLIKNNNDKIEILKNTDYYNLKNIRNRTIFKKLIDNKIILTLEYFLRVLFKKKYYLNFEISKKITNEGKKICLKNIGNSKILINKISLIELGLNEITIPSLNNSIEGYIEKNSFFAGEEIEIKCHTFYEKFNVEFFKYPFLNDKIISFNDISGIKQKYNFNAYLNGADWKTTNKFIIPNHWASGLYMIKLFDKKTEFFFSFVIKDKISKEITILTPTNTWQAYNEWGGASFYKYNLNRKEKKTNVNILNFNRPNLSSSPFQESDHLADQEIYFYKWIDENKYNYSTIDDLDLHNNYDLSKTKILVINNHSEYWTKNMVDNLQNYLTRGGNLINLSGNNIFWKSVINNNQLETIKYLGSHSLKKERSGMWRYLNKSESSILGSSYDTRGYKTYAPYKVKTRRHWILKDTNLNESSIFGFNNLNKKHASGYETNKIDNFSPKNIELIASGINPKDGGADMTYYENIYGGKVFSTGSISYCSCLQSDSSCSKILKNAIDEFLK